MTELELRIQNAAQKYYTDGSSELTDEEFDQLVDELRRKQPDSKLLSIGWGYNVSKDSTPGEKFKHLYGIAGSLDKCRTWKELGKSLWNSIVDISLKLDGISVVLYYQNGLLYQALTRGNGEIGIDITDKIRHLVITSLEYDFTGAVRGEILMPVDKFERWIDAHPDAKNPRNTTAGIINSKDWTIDDLSYLRLIVYTIVGIESIEDVFDTDKIETYQIRSKLIKWFGEDNVVPLYGPCRLNENNFIDDMNSLRASFDTYGYPSDGLVITNQNLISSALPEISYDAKAFKFPAEERRTVVEEVIWNMSKTRYAVPKIRVRPIQLSGTTVSFCTGYNAEFIYKNKIGKGAEVSIAKQGEIIPNIKYIHKSAEKPDMIYECPTCGCDLEWEGVHLKCINPECSNATVQDMLIWITTLVPTDGIGTTLILKFMDELIDIEDYSVEGLMKFEHRLNEEMNSIQWNTFAKMINTLKYDKNTKFSLVNALQALNIPRLGSINAIKLAAYPEDVKLLMRCALGECTLTADFWYGLKNKFGSANADSCNNNLYKFARLGFIEDRIIWETKTVESKGKVAITGKLSVKRADFERELNSAGYTVGDISKDTNFLITDNPNSSSSKNKKADQWGITKITELEFRMRYM